MLSIRINSLFIIDIGFKALMVLEKRWPYKQLLAVLDCQKIKKFAPNNLRSVLATFEGTFDKCAFVVKLPLVSLSCA